MVYLNFSRLISSELFSVCLRSFRIWSCFRLLVFDIKFRHSLWWFKLIMLIQVRCACFVSKLPFSVNFAFTFTFYYLYISRLRFRCFYLVDGQFGLPVCVRFHNWVCLLRNLMTLSGSLIYFFHAFHSNEACLMLVSALYFYRWSAILEIFF